jgi:hypothetical protein
MGDYVGLDVHSRESVFVVQQADGVVIGRGCIPTDLTGFHQLRDQHALPSGTPVALETGTLAFFAARALAPIELQPIVIDAHEVRAKAHRPTQKSDRRDAFELCEGIRRGSIVPWCMSRAPRSVSSARPSRAALRHSLAAEVEVDRIPELLDEIERLGRVERTGVLDSTRPDSRKSLHYERLRTLRPRPAARADWQAVS